jgi:hypothetical protein
MHLRGAVCVKHLAQIEIVTFGPVAITPIDRSNGAATARGTRMRLIDTNAAIHAATAKLGGIAATTRAAAAASGTILLDCDERPGETNCNLRHLPMR